MSMNTNCLVSGVKNFSGYFEPRPVSILCLDGGGMRGLIELSMLQFLEDYFSKKHGGVRLMYISIY